MRPVPPTPEQLRAIDPAMLTSFYGQRLQWHSCRGSFECASLQVPLDYSHPQGATLSLAVLRLRADGTRVGSVVLNPGGPGASGIDYAAAVGERVRSVLGDRFDVVSFDPRGVGASDPVRCLTPAQEDAWNAFVADPAIATDVAKQGQLAAQFAQGCEQRAGALLAHVSTVDTARDLDVLRAALGDARLTYIGASYGTFLGAIYAQLFPTHVRALVLDGVVDPAASAIDVDDVQAQGFEVALGAFLQWCSAGRSCPLPASGGEAKLDAWLASVSTRPIKGSGTRTLTEALAIDGIAASLYSRPEWPSLSAALAAGLRGDGSPLLARADAFNGRNAKGQYSNLSEAFTAISCADHPSLGDLAAYASAARAGAANGPTFGSFIGWGITPCAYWPVPPELAPGPVRAVGAPPILVVGTTRDPATPYRWAVAVSHELASARLLTYNGDGHTAFMRGSSCIDDAIAAYVVSLRLPPDAEECGPG